MVSSSAEKMAVLNIKKREESAEVQPELLHSVTALCSPYLIDAEALVHFGGIANGL